METRWIIGICFGVFVVGVLVWLMSAKSAPPSLVGRYQITAIVNGGPPRLPQSDPLPLLVIESTGGNEIKIYAEGQPYLHEIGTYSGSPDIALTIPPTSGNGVLNPARGKILSVVGNGMLELFIPESGGMAKVSLMRM